MQRAISFKDATMVYVNGNHYRTHFWFISKNEALNFSRNVSFTQKSRSVILVILKLKNINFTYTKSLSLLVT